MDLQKKFITKGKKIITPSTPVADPKGNHFHKGIQLQSKWFRRIG